MCRPTDFRDTFSLQFNDVIINEAIFDLYCFPECLTLDLRYAGAILNIEGFIYEILRYQEFLPFHSKLNELFIIE